MIPLLALLALCNPDALLDRKLALQRELVRNPSAELRQEYAEATRAYLAGCSGSPIAYQRARVVVLAPEDAALAQAAYKDLQAAQKRWAAVKADIEKRYRPKDADWGYWEFSEDFRAIAPMF